MAVKLTGSLSLTEINTEWTLGFDLDAYRGTNWFLTPSYSGPRSPRGQFGPDIGSGYTAVSYSDFYGTGRFAPTTTEKVWLVGGGGGGGAAGGGGGGGGVRPANVTITGGGTYTVQVGTGGVGGYRAGPAFNPTGKPESTNGNSSTFHNTTVGGGGFGSAVHHGGHWPYSTFSNTHKDYSHPQGGGGGGGSHTNAYAIGGEGGAYGAGGGNNIGFGPAAHPYAGGGGGGGGYQARAGWNGYGGYSTNSRTYNANVDRFWSPSYSGFTGNGYYPHTYPAGGPVNTPNKTGDFDEKAGPGGYGTYTWPGVANMGRHGGGGGGGWTKFSNGSISSPIAGWGGNAPGSAGSGGGGAGAPEPSTLGTQRQGTAGAAGQGGGGGGGGTEVGNIAATLINVCKGGNGGSGAVYLAYTAPLIGVGYPSNGHCTYKTGNYQIHKWTQSGSYYHGDGVEGDQDC